MVEWKSIYQIIFYIKFVLFFPFCKSEICLIDCKSYLIFIKIDFVFSLYEKHFVLTAKSLLCMCIHKLYSFLKLLLGVFCFVFLVRNCPICMFLHIHHHTVIQHHIEKGDKHTADCTQQHIRVATS